MTKHTIVQVTTTLDTKEQADLVAKQLVEKRLAACVQVSGPIVSTYRWQGEINQSQEYRCQMKTTDQALERLIETLEELHPYDTPEIVCHRALAVNDAYGTWVAENTDATTDGTSA